PAFAQIPATTDDQQAAGSAGYGQGILNTGTDAIEIKTVQEREDFFLDGNFQVMVWDGEQPSLSWAGTTPDGEEVRDFLTLDNCFRDPDVVVHTLNGKLYAMVVFEDHEGHIRYESYLWDGSSTFNFHTSSPNPLGGNEATGGGG